VIVFNKDSGGNIQLRDYTQSLLESHESVIDVSLFNDGFPSVGSFLSLVWYLFNGIFNKNLRLVYSDPLICILDLLPGIKLTRFVQSIDNELYLGHPRIPAVIQKALSQFIIFCNRRGFGDIVVCLLLADPSVLSGLHYVSHYHLRKKQAVTEIKYAQLCLILN